MADFKLLTEEELSKLSSKDRRAYLKAKKEYDNKKLVDSTLESDESPTKTIDDAKVEDHSSVKQEEKKSNAGRPKKDPKDKKKQMVLTLTPTTYEKLLEWAATKPRTAPNYVSDFIEEHIDEITK